MARVLAPAALAFAAGTGTAPLASAQPPGDSGGPGRPQVVTMWVPARGGYLEEWRRAARLAGQLDPSVTIRMEPIWADYVATVTLALAEGRAPPLVAVSPQWAARLAARGWLAEVTQPARSRGLPEAALAPFTLDGDAVWAVPGFADPAVVYVNADLLARAGARGPQEGWTWADLASAASAVAGLDAGAWGMPVNGWPPLELFVWQAGGWVVQAPNRLWDDPGPVVQAARFYRWFLTQGLSPRPPDSWVQPLDAHYREGRAAFMVGLYSHRLEQASARRTPFAAQVARLPVGPSGAPVGWMWVEGVAASHPSGPAAEAALRALARALGELGPLPPTARRPEADAVALQELQHARTLPGIPAYLEFDAAWWKHVVEPLLTRPEPLDVAGLLAEARPALQRALGSPPRLLTGS